MGNPYSSLLILKHKRCWKGQFFLFLLKSGKETGQQFNPVQGNKMLVYHGTYRKAAHTIVGPPANVDVTIGGGELGRGFYVGESLALAAAWAKARWQAQNPSIVKLDVNDVYYAQLSILVLNWNRVVNTWTQLQYSGTENSHLFYRDVVYGPLVTYPHAAQHKFESFRAQTILNNSSLQVI